MIILDGKAAAADIRKELSARIAKAEVSGIRPPGLAVILVGDNPASRVYVRNKQKACEEAGINLDLHKLPETISQQELEKLIEKLNSDSGIDGILLQLPLPGSLNVQACLEKIDPEKDVDGFHPVNAGKTLLGLPSFVPCTPAGVMELLSRYNLSLDGAKAVIVGRSDIVGKPLAALLSRKTANATVTICHSGTRNLKKECSEADFLFLAMGSPKIISGDMIKEGCVVVDIGINRTEEGLCGDADYASVCEKASAITPVPGGIGPMTVAMLLKNTVQSWTKRLHLDGSSVLS